MDLRKAWIRLVIVSVWILSFAALAPGAHVAAAVWGGTSETDVCRQIAILRTVACGVMSQAGDSGVAIGYGTTDYGYSNVLIGTHATVTDTHSIAIGGPIIEGTTEYYTFTLGDGAIAVGAGARVLSYGSISLGMRAEANGARSVVLGDRSTDDGRAGVVSFGNENFQRDLIYVKDITSSGVVSAHSFLASGDMEVESATVRNALIVSAGGASITGGINANNAKVVGVAGGEISATSLDAVNGSQLYQTRLELQAAQADAQAALAGLQDIVNQLLQLGVCNLSGGSVDCSTKLELGGGTVAAGADHAIAIGDGANAFSSGGIAMGYNATAILSNSVAIGAGATALSSVAVGTGAQAVGTNTTAIGDDAVASGEYAAAFGNGAQATHDNSVAIGSGSTTSAPNTVSVGSAGNERRITNVAPGVLGTDAVNVDQLYAAIMALGGVSQQYVDEQIASLRVEMARGIAAAAAMKNVQPSTVGKTAVGVGVGLFQGQTAFGFSLARAPKEGVLLSLGAASTVGGSPLVQGGLSFEF